MSTQPHSFRPAPPVARPDQARVPRHIGIIMDGNGRWAHRRNLPRLAGHRAGVAAVRDTVEASVELGIEALTLYAFSVENWRRPHREIQGLMALLRRFLVTERRLMIRNGVRFRAIGRWHELAPELVAEIEACRDATRDCRRLSLNVAINYSARAEITEACRRLVADMAAGTAVSPSTAALEARLETAGLPPVDLIIRTSGEQRLSNFLLWQAAHAELWFTPLMWPDFRRNELARAIEEFQRRRAKRSKATERPRPRPPQKARRP